MSDIPEIRVVRLRLVSTLALDVEVCGSRLVRPLTEHVEVQAALELPTGLERLRLPEGPYVLSGPLSADEHAAVLDAVTGEQFTRDVEDRTVAQVRHVVERINGA